MKALLCIALPCLALFINSIQVLYRLYNKVIFKIIDSKARQCKGKGKAGEGKGKGKAGEGKGKGKAREGKG